MDTIRIVDIDIIFIVDIVLIVDGANIVDSVDEAPHEQTGSLIASACFLLPYDWMDVRS